MGEQDALPSTQDADAGSDVALTTLPEVVISPQVTSGKVIDALRQFLPREVLVEVVERVETESQIAAAAVSAARGVQDDSALPVEAFAAEPAMPMAIEMPAKIDPVAEASPVIPAVMLAPIPPLPAIPTPPLASTSSAPAAQARRKRKGAPALPVAASVAPSPLPILTIAAAEKPCPTVSTSSPATQAQPRATYSGSLPCPKIDDAYLIEGTARRSASSGWLTRLSRWLMPDVVGRLIQHPVLSILTGIGFGLLVLWWLLGQ